MLIFRYPSPTRIPCQSSQTAQIYYYILYTMQVQSRQRTTPLKASSARIRVPWMNTKGSCNCNSSSNSRSNCSGSSNCSGNSNKLRTLLAEIGRNFIKCSRIQIRYTKPKILASDRFTRTHTHSQSHMRAQIYVCAIRIQMHIEIRL